ncbi:dTDP-4-dehydrorhamnose reductase [Ruegeria sp. HKCCD8929]|uniref:dTDP-4-dehydrorhamnose reductase n=1 Tax=Ruegeria sp. HKCCD8929 TaxID=2683006 RepID=UPI0014891FE6|nr:dTDP-4-dehydrorhamnose reductase [Ruegeria sp. HKCCD8929]
MTLLVFGRTGQLAQALAAQAQVTCLGRDRADLSDPTACVAAIRVIKPRAVINAAAYTAVDRAEAEEAQAIVVNAETPGAMAQECARLGVPFVSVSTDYVFDGSGAAPWGPGDRPAPLNAYGRSKLAGERAVAGAGGAWAVIRTAWVFSGQDGNFVTTLLARARERERLAVVDDQIGGPTPARALAAACLAVADQLAGDSGKAGLYHFAGTPEVSRAGFAREIVAQAGLACEIEDVPSSHYPAPARRPLNSRLDCTAFTATFGLARPDWRQDLRILLQERGEAA